MGLSTRGILSLLKLLELVSGIPDARIGHSLATFLMHHFALVISSFSLFFWLNSENTVLIFRTGWMYLGDKHHSHVGCYMLPSVPGNWLFWHLKGLTRSRACPQTFLTSEGTYKSDNLFDLPVLPFIWRLVYFSIILTQFFRPSQELSLIWENSTGTYAQILWLISGETSARQFYDLN